jgi:hypothetical protein
MRKAPSNLDIRLGSPVLPASITKVTTDHRGALAAYVDGTSHDLDLLAEVGAAIRDEGRSVADLLVRYADARDALDAAERGSDYALKRTLEDDCADLIAGLDIDALGEPVVATLRPSDTAALIEGLVAEAVAA